MGMHRLGYPLTLALLMVAAGMFVLIVIGIFAPSAGLRLADSDAPPVPDLLELAQPIVVSTPSIEGAIRATAAVEGPTPSPTPFPTLTPTLPYTPTTGPILAAPAQTAVALDGIRHVWQTWNNCGPATLTMNLSYFGHPLDQAEVGAALRRHPDDKNVGPQELVAYARSQGFEAQVRVNGSVRLLRRLLSNGIPVLIETWHEDQGEEGLGHYRLLTGYDDAAGHWIAYDTYDATKLVRPGGPYAGLYVPYGQLDRLWRFFNRTYLLIYPGEQAGLIAQILAADSSPDTMWEDALATAAAEIEADPDDPIAWFNLGAGANALGETEQAVAAFDRARALGLPWRMFWYQFGAFEAYASEARYSDLLALVDETLASVASIEELHYWRGVALSGLGQADAAGAAWRQSVALNPEFQPALDALAAS